MIGMLFDVYLCKSQVAALLLASVQIPIAV